MKCVVVIAVCALFFSGCGGAKETQTVAASGSSLLENSLAQVTSALSAQDYRKAFTSLRSSLELFWKESPLILLNVRFVKDDDNDYGIYEPKDKNEFNPGEAVYLYCEPIGYTLKKNEAGYNEFGFTADFSVQDENGTVLGGQENFANLKFESWNFNTEVALTFTYTFDGVERGRYKIITQVKDAYSDKKITTEDWIVIK